MLKSRRRSERPITELSDKALKQRIREAQRVVEAIPDKPPHAEMQTHLAVADAAVRDRKAASAELDRRAQAREQARQEARAAAMRHGARLRARSPQAKALDIVAGFAHPEVVGVTLTPSRLTNAEGEDLLALARRRRGDDPQAEPLSDAEEARYLTLVGTAAGTPDLFERKRSARAEAEKLDALRRAERAHPEASSILAAVLSDAALLDGLRYRIRTDVTVLDDYGREVPGGTACRIYEYDNVAALHALLSLISENGGHEIHVRERGVLGDGLPNLPNGSISQLCRNGYLTRAQDGTGMRVGLGPRTREIAARWGIALPGPPAAAGA